MKNQWNVRNRWEISEKYCEKSVGASATLREIFQMSPISCKSLNGANSGSRGPREETKKGKSSEFDARNYEQVKFSLAPKVWSQEGSNLHPKKCQNFITQIGGCGAKISHGYDPGAVVPA